MTEEKSIFSEFPLSDEQLSVLDERDRDGDCEKCPIDKYCDSFEIIECENVIRSAKCLDAHIKSLLKNDDKFVAESECEKPLGITVSVNDNGKIINYTRKEAVKAAEEYALSVASDGKFVRIIHDDAGIINVEEISGNDVGKNRTKIVMQFKYHEMQPGYVYVVWDNRSELKFYAVFSGDYRNGAPLFKNSLNGAICSTYDHWKPTGIKAE